MVNNGTGDIGSYNLEYKMHRWKYMKM